MTVPPRRTRNSSFAGHAGLRTELVNAVAGLLTQARSALFITGVGLSADSGLAHHRGISGLQRRTREHGAELEAALSFDGLHHDPAATWKVLLEIDAAVRAAAPNRGHEVLAALERELPRIVVMTTNIDRLHQRAGSRGVIEMHGALHDLLCTRCELSARHERFDRLAIPPRCTTCGTVLRPDMPLFGEALPADPFTRLEAELEAGFDVVVAVGISTMFPYLARPLLLAKADGIPTVEIGSTATEISDIVDFRFRGSPARVLELLHAEYTQLPRSGIR
ncbi:MAG: SIR2 family NAD-dependent protein deacylase [Kofleriaceae bacterium]